MDSNDVYLLGMIYAIRIEVDGMIAENTRRVIDNVWPAYNDDDFQAKAEEIRNLLSEPRL